MQSKLDSSEKKKSATEKNVHNELCRTVSKLILFKFAGVPVKKHEVKDCLGGELSKIKEGCEQAPILAFFNQLPIEIEFVWRA